MDLSMLALGGMGSGSYLIYFAIIMIVPLLAQRKVKSAYTKYSQVRAYNGMSGAQVARKILDENGLQNVSVEPIAGQLTDHYDPRTKVVRLSEGNFNSPSLAATAIAAHECGHAIQDSENYAFLKLRSTLVPIANIGSQFSYILIIAGFLLTVSGLILAGIVFMLGAVVFQLVTLPVEFNASSRAMDQVVALGIIQSDEERETKKVLSAAAMTYVAAAAVAVAELLRFVLMFLGSRDRQ